MVRATLGEVQRLLFQGAFADCSATEPYSMYSSLLVPCFLPDVIHLMPVSLGLYPKGTYRTVLHYSLLIGIHVYVEG